MDEYVTILSTNYCPKPSEAHFYVKNIMELNPSVQELRAVKRKIKAALRNRPELCNAIFAAFGHYEKPHPKFYKLITLVTATSLWHFLANTAAEHRRCPFHITPLTEKLQHGSTSTPFFWARSHSWEPNLISGGSH